MNQKLYSCYNFYLLLNWNCKLFYVNFFCSYDFRVVKGFSKFFYRNYNSFTNSIFFTKIVNNFLI